MGRLNGLWVVGAFTILGAGCVIVGSRPPGPGSSCGVSSGTCADYECGSGAPVSFTGSTVGAANSRTGTCGITAGPDIAMRWTPTVSRSYTIDTFGSNFDTVLYVEDSTCQTSLICNDDSGGTLQSSVTVSLAAGQAVIIVVDGFGSGSSGSYVLNIN